MVGRCIVAGCSNTAQDRVTSLHNWPKEPRQSRLWKEFVSRRRAKWLGPTKRSVVCSAHFTPDQFSNYKKFRMGYVKHLALKDYAIPTIQPPAQNAGTTKSHVQSARTAPPTRTAFPKETVKEVRLIVHIKTLK